MCRVGQLWTELRRVRQFWVETAADPLQPGPLIQVQNQSRLGRWPASVLVDNATIP